MITESEISVEDVDDFTIPKFGVMFGTNLCASFDKVEKDKKVELLKLTLYKNLAISETMDMVDLLSKQPKLNQVNMLASPQRCKVTIENDLPVDLVKIKRSLQSKKKKFINFISISD